MVWARAGKIVLFWFGSGSIGWDEFRQSQEKHHYNAKPAQTIL